VVLVLAGGGGGPGMGHGLDIGGGNVRGRMPIRSLRFTGKFL